MRIVGNSLILDDFARCSDGQGIALEASRSGDVVLSPSLVRFIFQVAQTTIVNPEFEL